MVERFVELYNTVFDDKGNIKACGRDTCKKLIETANTLANSRDFGNIATGFMNTDELHELYKLVRS